MTNAPTIGSPLESCTLPLIAARVPEAPAPSGHDKTAAIAIAEITALRHRMDRIKISP
jgi:hypothetical protein